MTRNITVEPLGEGWTVRTAGLDNDMAFLSGRAAELAASALGRRLADAGEAVDVFIRLRDGSLAGELLHRPWRVVED